MPQEEVDAHTISLIKSQGLGDHRSRREPRMVMLSVLVRLSIVEIKHCDQKQLREESFILT